MDDLATPIFLLQSPLQRRAVQPWQQRLDPYAEHLSQQRPACFCRATALSAHRMDRCNSAAHLNQACAAMLQRLLAVVAIKERRTCCR